MRCKLKAPDRRVGGEHAEQDDRQPQGRLWLRGRVVVHQPEDGPLGPRGLVEATEMCTQECLVLGHSDNCWMPPTLGTYQQPKSPVSNFGSQREWGPKDKLLNGHTLTRAWKNESGRSDHFGDRKQFGSGEGHFNSSGMADIPLVSLKSCQPAACPDSPKDQQL
ncbi:unnamed protein product [Pleuronectes platessa]|uniref:Protocadherin-9 n=1 Tax=Pleuronectes platessa TaxID=8262 RepID=A0A9N7TRB0_PLEPL|nr:unnamed protein product [Pleuronectes platessa]